MMSSIDEIKIKSKVKELVKLCCTMTIATSNGCLPWIAPVSYIYNDTMFYFLSNPNSRHIKESVISKSVAVSIHSKYLTWREIKGVQMNGKIITVENSFEIIKVMKRYLEKFSSVKEFLKADNVSSIKNFITDFNVKLYKFHPKIVFYLDNSIKFGFREKVSL